MHCLTDFIVLQIEIKITVNSLCVLSIQYNKLLLKLVFIIEVDCLIYF